MKSKVFRHGDRTPVNTFVGDLYNETQWQKYGGYGQLTQTGMSQHYEYGKYLRDRYAKFLDPLYDRNKVFVRSTNIDRTLMSANAMLAGLFPPTDYQKFNEKLNWQPIPIHTNDYNTDPIFFPTENCPRYQELKTQVLNSKEYKETNMQYDVNV